VPFRFWILDVLKDMSHDVLLAPQSLDRGIIDADRLRQWRLTPHETQLALSLELWFRIFIDEDPEWTDRASTATGAFIGAGA
jgi:hypothetical protein